MPVLCQSAPRSAHQQDEHSNPEHAACHELPRQSRMKGLPAHASPHASPPALKHQVCCLINPHCCCHTPRAGQPPRQTAANLHRSGSQSHLHLRVLPACAGSAVRGAASLGVGGGCHDQRRVPIRAGGRCSEASGAAKGGPYHCSRKLQGRWELWISAFCPASY